MAQNNSTGERPQTGLARLPESVGSDRNPGPPPVSNSQKDARRKTMNAENATTQDLQAQLESLFDAVWLCERQWRIDDRFDLLLGNKQR